ncbi:ATPase [Clostridium bowmanii]|uniref:ATP cone domain-containing protein n=1 Tax=Clostridium bowmanii TaxID=132925 RepID=UPI001C0BCD22|nr:ATP cone domain-containing protein [Clostridium bowmanii]MBU3192018.1 ATPase [Clostridium bowmanii]MCA1076308.1 ATPase [Clostridium bowmanii]
MKVVKRDGRLQEFDLNKIKTSIYRASDDAGQPLNESDIENLARNIEKGLQNYQKSSVHFDIIQKFVLRELEKQGFGVVATYYNQGKIE